MRKRYKSSYEQGLDEDTDWNFIVGYFKLLVNRMEQVDTAANMGSLINWYRGLRTFYRDVRDTIRIKTYKHDQDAFEDFDNAVKTAFSKIAEVLSTEYSTSNRNLVAQMDSYKFSEAEDQLDQLNTLIYSKLHDAGVIYQPKKEWNWEDEERQSYPE